MFNSLISAFYSKHTTIIDILPRLKNASVRTGFEQMKRDGENFKASVSKSLMGAFDIKKVLNPFSAALAGIAGAFSLDKVFSKVSDISGVAKQFGISTDEAQRFQAMAKKVNVDMETLARGGFKAFEQAQAAVSGDSKEA